MKAKGDYQDKVHSDQLVLVIVRRGGLDSLSSGHRQTKGSTMAESTRVRWFSGSQLGEAGCVISDQRPRTIKKSLTLKGDNQALVHSDLMVLVVVCGGG
jgi:hypothetical protein